MSDERRARDILAAWVADNPDVPPTPPRAQVALVESLAAALAQERRKALLDAADALHKLMPELDWDDWLRARAGGNGE